jgi:hypothetical protein
LGKKNKEDTRKQRLKKKAESFSFDSDSSVKLLFFSGIINVNKSSKPFS